MASMTSAPLPNSVRDTRSAFASNELMKVRVASLTAAHRPPIELDTSMTSDRSTMRRVASPVLLTFRTWKFASFMNVVGQLRRRPSPRRC